MNDDRFIAKVGGNAEVMGSRFYYYADFGGHVRSVLKFKK